MTLLFIINNCETRLCQDKYFDLKCSFCSRVRHCRSWLCRIQSGNERKQKRRVSHVEKTHEIILIVITLFVCLYVCVRARACFLVTMSLQRFAVAPSRGATHISVTSIQHWERDSSFPQKAQRASRCMGARASMRGIGRWDLSQ